MIAPAGRPGRSSSRSSSSKPPHPGRGGQDQRAQAPPAPRARRALTATANGHGDQHHLARGQHRLADAVGRPGRGPAEVVGPAPAGGRGQPSQDDQHQRGAGPEQHEAHDVARVAEVAVAGRAAVEHRSRGRAGVPTAAAVAAWYAGRRAGTSAVRSTSRPDVDPGPAVTKARRHDPPGHRAPAPQRRRPLRSRTSSTSSARGWKARALLGRDHSAPGRARRRRVVGDAAAVEQVERVIRRRGGSCSGRSKRRVPDLVARHLRRRAATSAASGGSRLTSTASAAGHVGVEPKRVAPRRPRRRPAPSRRGGRRCRARRGATGTDWAMSIIRLSVPQLGLAADVGRRGRRQQLGREPAISQRGRRPAGPAPGRSA